MDCLARGGRGCIYSRTFASQLARSDQGSHRNAIYIYVRIYMYTYVPITNITILNYNARLV